MTYESTIKAAISDAADEHDLLALQLAEEGELSDEALVLATARQAPLSEYVEL